MTVALLMMSVVSGVGNGRRQGIGDTPAGRDINRVVDIAGTAGGTGCPCPAVQVQVAPVSEEGMVSETVAPVTALGPALLTTIV